MKRQMLVGAAIWLVIAAVVSERALGQTAAAPDSRRGPIFQVDPAFFKIPNDWVIGQGSSVSVDKAVRKSSCWIVRA